MSISVVSVGNPSAGQKIVRRRLLVFVSIIVVLIFLPVVTRRFYLVDLVDDLLEYVILGIYFVGLAFYVTFARRTLVVWWFWNILFLCFQWIEGLSDWSGVWIHDCSANISQNPRMFRLLIPAYSAFAWSSCWYWWQVVFVFFVLADRFSDRSLPVRPLLITFVSTTKFTWNFVVVTCMFQVSWADYFFSGFLDYSKIVADYILWAAAFGTFSLG